jgi:glycosyltransferase involved in cell wall biosynthesis
MRILINALGATMGGALRHLTNFIPALAASPGGHTYEILVRSSVSVSSPHSSVLLNRWNDRHAASSIHRAITDLVTSSIQAKRYDVLVSLMNFGPIWCPIPHVIFQRNALYYSATYRHSLSTSARVDLALRRRWTIEAMRFADVVVTPTSAMADLILEDCRGLRRCRFQTLYHGFDLSNFERKAAKQSDAAFGHPNILYTAHLGRYKNFEVLLRALAILRETYPDIRLILTFGPEDHLIDFDYYESMTVRLGVRSNVTFIGRVQQERIGELYRSVDVFLFPSLYESFGFPLIEAMGFGLPIVASDIPSTRELCKEAALYFNASDEKSCATCILRVLKEPACADALIQRGADILQSFDWSWQRYAREFTGILERVAMRQAA